MHTMFLKIHVLYLIIVSMYQLASSSKFCTERVRCFFLSFSWLEIVVVRKDTRYWGREKAERERESEWVWKGAQWYAYFSSIHRYFYLSSQSLALFCQSIVCCILCIWFESFFFFRVEKCMFGSDVQTKNHTKIS